MADTVFDDRKVPMLKPGLNYTLDRERGMWLLQDEDGTVLPPPEATEIMGLMDGRKSIAGIVEHMAEASGRPEADVSAEVHGFIDAMAARGILVMR